MIQEIASVLKSTASMEQNCMNNANTIAATLLTSVPSKLSIGWPVQYQNYNVDSWLAAIAAECHESCCRITETSQDVVALLTAAEQQATSGSNAAGARLLSGYLRMLSFDCTLRTNKQQERSEEEEERCGEGINSFAALYAYICYYYNIVICDQRKAITTNSNVYTNEANNIQRTNDTNGTKQCDKHEFYSCCRFGVSGKQCLLPSSNTTGCSRPLVRPLWRVPCVAMSRYTSHYYLRSQTFQPIGEHHQSTAAVCHSIISSCA
ncbi:hypothetical protein BDF19DRAFT_411484 [Syncephalis fuscata]|nr:hypothetical protein BDF19DRAFT_411484 [Syncephalis fuscata]